MRETLPDAVAWENLQISYRYYHSFRKTLGISVFPDLSVLVRAPRGTSREAMRRFVLERAGWILRAQRRFAQRPLPQPLSYRSGESHDYAGRTYRLEINTGPKDRVTCLSDRLIVTVRHDPTEEKTRRLLGRWYRGRADILFHERLIACHQHVINEAIPMPALRIRKMRSRWGSFSLKNGITLNLALILVPVECLDYVIIHELCHYKIGGHGPRFWRLLARLLPECKERKRRLNAYSAHLQLP